MQTQERPSTHPKDPTLETLNLVQSLHQEIKTLKQELSVLRSQLGQQLTLGFNNGRNYIIIERDKGFLWHRFEDDQPVPIKEKLLKGYIKRVAFIDKEYPKLHVFIQGDREYVLVTGFETHFSRELMAAIASLRPEDLMYPVIIKPDTGSEEGESKSKHKPVFCNVIHRGHTVKPGSLRNMDIQQLFQRAEAVLKGDRVTQSTQLPSRVQQTKPAAQIPQFVDWPGVCQDLGISSGQLKAVAKELGLPHGKLSRSQAGQLYQAVYGRFGRVAG